MEKYDHKYGAEQIQVLDGLEHVRKRPGMYIGSVSVRGLHHCVYEIVDNAVDEALAGYCKNIHVTIEPGNVICVEDDGRGIPVDIHKKTKISAAETVYTQLNAGGKFGGDSGYKVSGGLHGVGASVVNALSEWVEVTIQRDGGIFQMKFNRGKTIQSLERIGDSDKTGTKVRFLADDTIFESLEYEYETLEKRFREMAFLTKGLRITIEDKRVNEEENETPKKADFCFEGGWKSFVEFLNKNKETLHKTPIYIEKTDGEVPVEIAIQYTSSYSENIYTFVNNININDYARSHNILKEKDSNLQGEDIREGITAVVSVKVKEPQFEGQTKTKLGNSEVTGVVQSMVNEALSTFLEENPNVAKSILEKCISASRAREAARKARELVRKKNSLETSTLPGKLADCSSKNADECEVYIVEGDSAGGSAKQGRDRKFQAILPLWGKMLNVEKARADKIYGNDKLNPVILAVGAGIGSDFDITKIRYGKVIIMADADVDGAHIRTLLLTFFFRYMRPLIENGNVYLAQPPLYKLSKKGMEDIYCYTDEDLDKAYKELEEKGIARDQLGLQRYKGLGEMNPEQLWDTTMNPETRILVKVTMEDAIKADENPEQLWDTTMNPETRILVKVTMEDAIKADEIFTLLMGDEVEPRREFIQKNAKYVKNLDI